MINVKQSLAARNVQKICLSKKEKRKKKDGHFPRISKATLNARALIERKSIIKIVFLVK